MIPTIEFASVETAQRLVTELVKPGPVELVPLDDALHRVLAEPLVCDMDYPPFDKAVMDGYAVRAGDITDQLSGATNKTARLAILGQVAAGHESTVRVGRNQAVQINTGAPLPAGADTVVPVEQVELSVDGATIAVSVAIAPGKHVERRAACVAAGTVVIEPGTRFSANHVAVAASAGAGHLRVYRQPRVSILVTGDELVGVDAVPTGPQIRNCNGPMLRALVRDCHAQPIELGVVRDDREALTAAILKGLEADLLCITGGISMGAFDLVPDALRECGVRFAFRKMTLKPGKPTTFGVTDQGAAVLALAGNPVGCFVGFWLLGRPAIECREGRSDTIPRRWAARLVGRCPGAGQRERYFPARVMIDAHGELHAECVSWRGSGDPFGFANANGLVVVSPGAGEAGPGDRVRVLLLQELQ